MLAQELQIYHDTENLLILLLKLQKQLNRAFKHSVGDRLVSKACDLFTHITKANRETDAKRRAYQLEQFLYDFEIIKTFIRVLEEIHEIDTKTSARIAVLTNAIGKQANGWKKSA